MLIPILTVAATCTAFADLEQRDSSQFTHKYEMLALPTAENVDGKGANDFAGIAANATWCTLGTGQDLGTISMTINGGQNIVSDKDNGTAGDAWHNLAATTGKDGGTGYTIEARLRITESTGKIGAVSLNASTGDSTINAWLVFTTDKVYWGNSTANMVKNFEVASAWHTYRIVRKHGETVHSVWIDGVLMGENFGSGINASMNRILLGGASNDYAGKAQVAYLRFTKGEYAPVDQKANRLDSTEFDTKYEMSNDDARISTSANASDWTISGTSGVTITKENGVLSITPPQGKQPYWRTTDAAWKNLVTEDTAYTVEFSTKINSCTISEDRTLQFLVATPRATGVLNVGMNHVYWQVSTTMSHNILLDSSVNSDKMHKFRITYDGATHHGFTVWRDDVKIGENLVDNTASALSGLSYVRFGIPGTTVGGAFDIGYIRWTHDGVHSPDTRKGMMIIVK